MAALNMSRETRICLAAFAMLSTAVTFNLLFFQGRRGASGVETAAIARLPGGQPSSIQGLPLSAASQNASAPPVAVAGAPAAPPVSPAQNGLTAPERPMPLASAPPAAAMTRNELVRALQRALATRGFEPGEPDGIMGLMTRAAIMAYESDSGLDITGAPSEDLLRRLEGVSPPPAPARTGPPAVKTIEAATIVRNVGQWLAALGYPVSKVETSMSPALVRAIRDYEASQKMPETGRISAPLVARLSRAAQGRLSQSR
ncbi:MAG TPA: peptidoglycan-binding domain-containing protein [Hyphomicrobium sp.]|nr:peptidoglycan-binding domain-containing protein [Hyphomicrobium sp.]